MSFKKEKRTQQNLGDERDEGTDPYIASCDEHNNIPRVLENENKLDVDLNEAVISTGNSFDDLTGPLLATKAPIFYSTISLHP